MLARASLFVAVPVLVVLAVCFVGGYRPICSVDLVVVVVLFAFVDSALTSQAILLFRFALGCEVDHRQHSMG